MNASQTKAAGAVLKELAQAYGDEAKARELLESWRWPNGPICPHCHNAGGKLISKLEAHGTSQSRVRAGVYFCGACRGQFTVTVGTILERSHVPLSKWLMALSLLCSSKKSLSANQIHRMIGVTYKTAWFMCHRIRLGMTPQPRVGGKVARHGGGGRNLCRAQGQGQSGGGGAGGTPGPSPGESDRRGHPEEPRCRVE